MSGILPVARRLLLVPLFGAAYGWQDLLRGLPGPRVGLVLPLREPSHQAAVPLLGLLAVWLVAWAIAARLVPVRRLPRGFAALLRGGVTFALLVLVQAVTLELVREATLGFAWSAACTSPLPVVAAGCAALATLLATPRRAPVPEALIRSDESRPPGGSPVRPRPPALEAASIAAWPDTSSPSSRSASPVPTSEQTSGRG